MTPLYIWTVSNSVISNNKKQVKQVVVSKKLSADKYFQIAQPDQNLLTIKF